MRRIGACIDFGLFNNVKRDCVAKDVVIKRLQDQIRDLVVANEWLKMELVYYKEIAKELAKELINNTDKIAPTSSHRHRRNMHRGRHYRKPDTI